MKKQIVIFVVGIAVFAVGYAVQGWALAQCQQPNPSEEGCADPTNEISTCLGAVSQKDQCDGKSLYTEPARRPIGTIPSKTGTTSTKRIDCVKEFACIWVPNEIGTGGRCCGEPDWDLLAYQRAQMIIVGPNQCPEG